MILHPEGHGYGDMGGGLPTPGELAFIYVSALIVLVTIALTLHWIGVARERRRMRGER